MLILHVDDMLL